MCGTRHVRIEHGNCGHFMLAPPLDATLCPVFQEYWSRYARWMSSGCRLGEHQPQPLCQNMETVSVHRTQSLCDGCIVLQVAQQTSMVNNTNKTRHQDILEWRRKVAETLRVPSISDEASVGFISDAAVCDATHTADDLPVEQLFQRTVGSAAQHETGQKQRIVGHSAPSLEYIWELAGFPTNQFYDGQDISPASFLPSYG